MKFIVGMLWLLGNFNLEGKAKGIDFLSLCMYGKILIANGIM